MQPQRKKHQENSQEEFSLKDFLMVLWLFITILIFSAYGFLIGCLFWLFVSVVMFAIVHKLEIRKEIADIEKQSQKRQILLNNEDAVKQPTDTTTTTDVNLFDDNLSQTTNKNKTNYSESFWDNTSDADWRAAEEHYWDLILSTNMQIEKELNNLDPLSVERMTPNEFYDFLYYKYYPWKFTDARYLKKNREHLEMKHCNNLSSLAAVQKELFSFDRNNIYKGLQIITTQVGGLGTAGASGLLAILFPKDFATVDKFVQAAMVDFGILDNKPMSDKLATQMISLMRDKADELNRVNHTNYWTPRKIDKVLWAYGRNK